MDGLKHNLLSISQLCDKGFKIEFNKNCCLISEAKCNEVIYIGKRLGNIYMLNIKQASFHEQSCLVSKIDDTWLWHCRTAHINMHHLNNLVRKDLVIVFQNSSLRKINRVKLVKKGSKLKPLSKQKHCFYFKTP